ncbi:hypothetical protein DF3PB_2640004 [uncultured Defluviicoccus sp.]|uniref:Uncharacterized protein n=1 Tax=metagenome TaxID=256318 RepID=A0A380TF46_9ZZZZ|nr:hypothetical protein DF3PB_2640004 [uncultured Defluviicoccus sp.]
MVSAPRTAGSKRELAHAGTELSLLPQDSSASLDASARAARHDALWTRLHSFVPDRLRKCDLRNCRRLSQMAWWRSLSR